MRIQFLDGFRGLAILLVVIYHAYAQWPEHYPYGDNYADIPVIKLGWLGVQLFFLISGFVIFMTLDKTESFRAFIYKRWIRLFPAMLVASLLIYLTLSFFHERPDGIPPNILSIVPGLTFTLPSWWSKLVGFEIPLLESAFWSLYVEFKFYIIAGVTYFFLGRAFLIPVLVTLFVFWLVTFVISTKIDSQYINLLQTISNALSLKHFGWFAAGAVLYIHFQTQNKQWLYAGVALMILSSLVVRIDALGFDSEVIIGALLISALFTVSFKSKLLQRILQTRVLVFFGFISYPLYLIHENAMTSMIIKMESGTPWLHPFLYPYPAIIFLTFTAYIIAKYVEPRLSGLFRLRPRFQASENSS